MNKASTNSTHNVLAVFIPLLLFWMMLAGSLSIETLMVGIVVSLLIALLYRNSLSFFTEFRVSPQAIVAGFKYYAYFFKELFISNIKLARIVHRFQNGRFGDRVKNHDLHPGFPGRQLSGFISHEAGLVFTGFQCGERGSAGLH